MKTFFTVTIVTGGIKWVKSRRINIDWSPESAATKKFWQRQSQYRNENLIEIVHIDYSLKDDHVPEPQQPFPGF